MKWFFWGICALTLLVVIRTLSDLGDKETIPKESRLPAITKIGSEQELRAENLQLREQIIQLNKEIVQLKHSASGNNSSQRGMAISQTSGGATESTNIQAKIQQFNNFLASDDSMTVLKTSFANEVVDNSWANTHQHKIEAFFKKSFTNVFPQYIECRSKRCKITVPVSDQKMFSELSQELVKNTLNNTDGIAKQIVIEPTENDGTLSFYLARNDEVSFLH